MEASPRSEFEPLTSDPVPDAPGTLPIPERVAAEALSAPEALGVLTAPAAASPVMDRDFIARNQIVERYLSGKLPVRGAMEFEHFCKEHPELLDEIGLPERVHASLELLDASGKPGRWQQQPRRFWEQPLLPLGLGVGVLVLLAAIFLFARNGSEQSRTIAALDARIAAQPLEPATTTRTIRLLPSREGASSTPAVVIGDGGQTQLADLRLDLSRSPYREYRVTIDRIDEGRVAILNDLGKDSKGHLRITLNSSALGPGNYQFTIEGLTPRGDPVPDSWVTIGIQH